MKKSQTFFFNSFIVKQCIFMKKYLDYTFEIFVMTIYKVEIISGFYLNHSKPFSNKKTIILNANKYFLVFLS